MTGFAKTDHNVTLGQLYFIGPANSYTHTLYPCIVVLMGLADWSAFLELVMSETMGPMEATRWEVWVSYSPLC